MTSQVGLLLTGAAEHGIDLKKHIVIMGTGLIGCEFANDLIASGFDAARKPAAAPS